MFDLTRFTELVGDFIGEANAGGGVQQILQNLEDHGIDISQLEELSSGEFLCLLNENGLELSQFDPGQLSQLADKLAIELPIGDLIDPFSGELPAP